MRENHKAITPNFLMRNTLVKTTLSCNLYGDPGPNPAGQAPSLPTRGCGSGGTPSTGCGQTRLDRPVLLTNDDLAGFGHIPWTGWWVGRGGALLKITLAGEEPGTRENCTLSVSVIRVYPLSGTRGF